MHPAPASDAVETPLVRLRLFGGFALARGARPIHLPTRKVELLLAYLTLFPGPHGREPLAALFWGDVPDEQARGSLRKALTLLRGALGPAVVLADRQAVQLNPDFPLWADVAEFERRVAHRTSSPAGLPDDAGQLAALDLYRDPLLPDDYDDWITPLRERFRAAFLERALALVAALRARSDYTRAVDMAQRVLAVDPANERAHQHLMFCYLALGRRHEALQQYEICKRALWDELAVAPSAATTALYRWLAQERGGRAAEALLTNLPVPLSSFIGRDAETAQVKGLFVAEGDALEPAATSRLVTLTGPGGSGKTRLAIQAATDLIDAFADGVWWVELAALTHGEHVVAAVARTLGVHESPSEPLLARLIAHVQPRRLLLVLDNCEHLVTACATLADDLLTACPRLSILATSRQALGLTGERARPVPTLAVPRAGHAPPASLSAYDGVRLFVERAQAVNPTFALTADNGPAVAQLCARLDGIPLALELAAMWLKTLTVEDVAARLDNRFELLMLGSRAAPLRHQTLRGVLDWSYDLLTEPEQLLFRRLSVFGGGWTVAAAHAIAGDEHMPPAALVLLHNLVDKSLVVAHQSPAGVRFSMLETIRDYAREQLRAAGEMDTLRARHLDWFLALAEAAEPGLRGAEQDRWLDTLDSELDNLRAALDWASATDVPKGLRLAGALAWYWNIRGHWLEGPAWLARLLDLSNEPTPARAVALVAAANLAFWGSNDYAAARAWLDAAVSIYRAAGDAWSLANALSLLGLVLNNLAERDAAVAALRESLALGEALGQSGRWVSAWAWMGLGDLSADPLSKGMMYERSAARFRELDDRAQLPVVLARLAWFHLGQKDYAQAEAFTRESVALTEAVGDVMGTAWMRKLEGDLAFAQGDLGRAGQQYRVALERFRALGSKSGIADTLDILGELALATGQPQEARRLWTEALALLREMEQKRSYDDLAARLAALDEC